MQEILAVDVGASKLAAARVTSDGLIKKQSSIPTKADDGNELFKNCLLYTSPSPRD